MNKDPLDAVGEFLEYLDRIETDEEKSHFEKCQARQRYLFFKAFGIEDDGRMNPTMTREEFIKFCQGKPYKDRFPYSETKGKLTVPIWFEFAAYEDISCVYCFDNNTIYESRFSIGD